MQLYISDLDGTLLDKNAEITKNTADILNELITQGIDFTVATARTYASAGKILAGLDLRLPLILMNGVLIYDPVGHEYLSVKTIPDTAREKILSLRDKLGLSPFMYMMEEGCMHTVFDKLINQSMKDFHAERVRKYYKSFTQAEKLEDVRGSVIYFCFIDTKDRLLPLRDELAKDKSLGMTFYPDIYGNDWYLEVFSASASKKAGVEWLRDRYGFEKITAFGDNLNDLPMFAAADECIAVSNAAEELKKQADKVIGANTEDGVAFYLKGAYHG
ncbi:MAG: Cof-type HAD-IIB family hydrolase [Ruminococcus sp.]|uniref:Cof-type HAD-IIB family hydrolase n=1 Tax=Ruminococcus sp. TaxID=41978 RepID=UPI0025FE2E21|nr:Cof-type HAD-IIB family hydrolase [Ruminococcus sp.]MBR0528346.1 Cof-type HAD-IIB family hydrolase [Ruminococcus sp.]